VRPFLALALMSILSACAPGGAGSIGSLNPFNWFGGGAAGQNQPAGPQSLAPRVGYGFVTDTRPLVGQITGLTIERTLSGAIVRATVQAPGRGYYNAALVAVASQNPAQLTLQFRALPPGQTVQPGAPQLRQLVAAVQLSRAQLRGIRTIQVVGAGNSRTIRP